MERGLGSAARTPQTSGVAAGGRGASSWAARATRGWGSARAAWQAAPTAGRTAAPSPATPTRFARGWVALATRDWAAGALVGPGKELESGFLYVGSPAKKLRQLTDRELEFLLYSAKGYVDLKNRYMSSKS